MLGFYIGSAVGAFILAAFLIVFLAKLTTSLSIFEDDPHSVPEGDVIHLAGFCPDGSPIRRISPDHRSDADRATDYCGWVEVGDSFHDVENAR